MHLNYIAICKSSRRHSETQSQFVVVSVIKDWILFSSGAESFSGKDKTLGLIHKI